MKALKLKKKYVKRTMLDKVGVIAISQRKTNPFKLKEPDKSPELYWYHVHDNEEIPNTGFDIAIHIR